MRRHGGVGSHLPRSQIRDYTVAQSVVLTAALRMDRQRNKRGAGEHAAMERL
jgi:hypothetical protein